MKVELVTAKEAKNLGLVHSRLLHEGHGAFGEPDNSYEYIVHLGKNIVVLSDNDLIIYKEESPNREVIQVINEWNCSNKLLEIVNPELLIKRKKDKYKMFVELKKEIDADDFYKPKATSLDGCPFNYCDSNPKCEGKCRYV
jgi:hypothetical protein